MGIRILALSLTVLPLTLFPAADGALARSLRADYAVTIGGLPVGKAKLTAEIADRHYSVAFSGGVSGFARLFTDAETGAEATGTIGDDRPRAESYSHFWIEDNETETVSMRFAGDGVTDIAIEPPVKRPERYVPMSAEAKAEAVDMVSAFLWPAAAGASPEACERTLPLIDGRRRFDIESAFSRMDSFATGNGSRYSRAVVCTLTYRPIAGHRIDKQEDGFLSGGGDIEVWLASAGDGIVAPVKVTVESRYGRVVMQATTFETE
ncbi:MAG: DUF3108 domain-containing protein [Propylenella sp.]